MAKLKCAKCGTVRDGARYEYCPNCLEQHLNNIPQYSMLRAKHDPDNLPSASDTYRSVVSEWAKNSANYIHDLSYGGTIFYDGRHKDYFLMVRPSFLKADQAAGSAIPPGYSMPTDPLYLSKLVKPFGPSAHVMAEDPDEVEDQLKNGFVTLSPKCSVPSCDNKASPFSDKCDAHRDDSAMWVIGGQPGLE